MLNFKKKTGCQNLCQTHYTRSRREMKIPKHREQVSSHGVPGKLDCVPISLPNLSEEPSPECQGTVHHLDSWEGGLHTTWIALGMQLGIVQHLDSIGTRNGECAPPGIASRLGISYFLQRTLLKPASPEHHTTAHLRNLPTNAVMCVLLMGMES